MEKVESLKAAVRYSLSQRERAGVRENGSKFIQRLNFPVSQPHLACNNPAKDAVCALAMSAKSYCESLPYLASAANSRSEAL